MSYGSPALWAMLTGVKSIKVEFYATMKECISHHVQAELRDPVYGWDDSSSEGLHLGEEEAMLVHGCADVCLHLTFTGNTANDPFIDTEVFNDICYLLDHCSRAKNLVFICAFKLKVPKGSTSATTQRLESDRRQLIVNHVLPLFKAPERLQQYTVIVKFIVDTPPGNAGRNGEENQPETYWALRETGMTWDDDRIERYAIRKFIDDEGDVAWRTKRWNLSPVAATLCTEVLHQIIGFGPGPLLSALSEAF